jgi:CheY-like chemotaxis protein
MSNAPCIRRRRILVVDDIQDCAVSFAMLLELEGHEAHVAYNGLESIELAAILAELLANTRASRRMAQAC